MGKIKRIIKAWGKYIASHTDNKDPSIWVFGEWFGKRCGDNCTFFANYLALQDNNLQLYWICKKEADTSMLNHRINRLEMDSEKANAVLTKAGVIFMNQNFLDVSSNPDNVYGKAITFNFWHGFPWKKIGHDGDKKSGLLFKLYCKAIDPILEAKYFNTFSDVYSTKLKSAFNVNISRMIRAGAPRNSGFYDQEFIKESRKQIELEIQKHNPIINMDHLKIIAYMPTFRDSGDKVYDFGVAFEEEYFNWLERNNIIIIQKAHFVDVENRNGQINKQNSIVLTIPWLNAATLMAAADILISDYSSCVFDYLILDRPVIHFVYDYEKYRDMDRGLYFDIDDIRCGRVACSIDELCEEIQRTINYQDDEVKLRKERRKEIMAYERNDSMQIIYQFIEEKIRMLVK